MSTKYKKVYSVLNYIMSTQLYQILQLLDAFPFLLLLLQLVFPKLKICVITTGIKKYKSIIKKKKKKHDNILQLAKSKLNSVEVLISKTSSDSSISHNEFILTNNVPKRFGDTNEKIKNSNDK